MYYLFIYVYVYVYISISIFVYLLIYLLLTCLRTYLFEGVITPNVSLQLEAQRQKKTFPLDHVLVIENLKEKEYSSLDPQTILNYFLRNLVSHTHCQHLLGEKSIFDRNLILRKKKKNTSWGIIDLFSSPNFNY